MLAIVNFSTSKQNKILAESLADVKRQNILLESQLKEMFEINNEMRTANENYSREAKIRECEDFFKREQERFIKNNIARRDEGKENDRAQYVIRQ